MHQVERELGPLLTRNHSQVWTQVSTKPDTRTVSGNGRCAALWHSAPDTLCSDTPR